jgi:hypothetical protein
MGYKSSVLQPQLHHSTLSIADFLVWSWALKSPSNNADSAVGSTSLPTKSGKYSQNPFQRGHNCNAQWDWDQGALKRPDGCSGWLTATPALRVTRLRGRPIKRSLRGMESLMWDEFQEEFVRAQRPSVHAFLEKVEGVSLTQSRINLFQDQQHVNWSEWAIGKMVLSKKTMVNYSLKRRWLWLLFFS